MYYQNNLSYNALRMFVEMLSLEHLLPDNYTYPFVFKACGDLLLVQTGILVHGQTFKLGYNFDSFVQNSLLAMYMNFGKTETAWRVFNLMREKTVVSWNTMINGCFQNGLANEALMVFDCMINKGVDPDCASLVSVLPACGYLKDLTLGRWIHKLVEENGLGSKISVMNSLVDMYAKCGSMDEARLVFDKMNLERDVVTWTAMINGYILNGNVRSALALTKQMQIEGVRPNSVTVASLLSACANLHFLKHGKSLHAWAMRGKLEPDVIVETALIDMYAKCNRVDLSCCVFGETSKKKTVPWNSIISGFVHNGLAREAIAHYRKMLMQEVKPNSATLNSLLPAYSVLADLQQARNVHTYLIRSGFLSNIESATGLIDVYAKCGNLESAHKVFNEVPYKDKDIVVWSVLIGSYGIHGHGKIAVSLFYQMLQSGIKPNDVTFTSVLQACSRSCLVDEGLSFLKLMLEDSQASPCADHYTCIVDLLGRAGRLREAYELIRTMPVEANYAVWGALLGSCVIHENVELGEIAASRLFKLEPENSGNYILMANIYTSAGRWKDAENLRLMMSEIGLRKNPAHSLIDVRNM